MLISVVIDIPAISLEELSETPILGVCLSNDLEGMLHTEQVLSPECSLKEASIVTVSTKSGGMLRELTDYKAQ